MWHSKLAPASGAAEASVLEATLAVKRTQICFTALIHAQFIFCIYYVTLLSLPAHSI